MPSKKLNLSSFGEDCSVPSRSRRRRLGLGLGVGLAAISLGHPAAAQFLFPGFPPPQQRAPACPDLLRRPDVAAFTRQFVRQNEDGQDIPDQVLATYRRELAAYLQVQLRPADFARVQGFVANLPTPTIALCVPQVMALANGSAYAANRPPGGPRDPMRSDTNNFIAEQQRDRAAQEQLRQSRIDAASQAQQAGQQDLARRLAAEDAELDARRKTALARETALREQTAARAEAERQTQLAEQAARDEERKAAAARDAEAQRQAAAREDTARAQRQAEAQRKQAVADAAAAEKRRQDAEPLAPFVEGGACPDWVQNPLLTAAIDEASQKAAFFIALQPALLKSDAFSIHRDVLTNDVAKGIGEPAFRSKAADAIRSISASVLAQCFPKVQPAIVADQEFIDEIKQRVAQEATPRGKLLSAYQSYIVVTQCADSRDGYALVYVSERELSDAKQQVTQIERTLVKRDSSLSASALWKEASQQSTGEPQTELQAFLALGDEKAKAAVRSHTITQEGKRYCGDAVSALSDTYRDVVPGAGAPVKDF